MAENMGRALPNERARRFMLAVQDVMGQSGLTTILRQAGLPRYVSALPPANDQPGLRASEYAALMQAIENYYGRGARGTLTRIGYAAFHRLVQANGLQAALLRLLMRLLPMRSRRAMALRWLARDMAGPDGRVTVQVSNGQLTLTDHMSDATCGRSRDSAICWVTLGQIQEALKWGTGQEYEVAEVACKATGAPSCVFTVGDPLG